MDLGPGPLRNVTAGIINYLAGTHNRVRSEVTDYFDEVREFAADQGDKVQEAVEIYETTDMEIAEMLDASMFLPARRAEVVELGRAVDLDPGREMATSVEPHDPADALKPLTDYRAEIPFQPDWVGGGIARDTIWQITYIATQLGLMSRPVDVIVDLIVPFTGDWAGMKTCGDALTNLADAASDLHANVGWIELRIDGVWLGNAADACWLKTRVLQQSLFYAQTVLRGYASAYEDVVTRIYDLEERAAEVLAEALDWAIAALLGKATLLGKLASLFAPPTNLVETVRLVFVLLDLVQLGVEAIWDFEARVELGLLHGLQADASMPDVPATSTGYH
jgi:hypothetical protein